MDRERKREGEREREEEGEREGEGERGREGRRGRGDGTQCVFLACILISRINDSVTWRASLHCQDSPELF